MDVTCFLKLILSSMVTPILRAALVLKTLSEPNVKASSCGLGRCCEEITISSVLSLFSFNLLAVIHLPISFIHDWIVSTDRSLCSDKVDSKNRYICVSSAERTDGIWHHVHVKCLQEVKYIKHTRLGQGRTLGVHQTLDYNMKRYFPWCVHTVSY